MSSTGIGNSIAVLPDGAGFDIYSAGSKYPDASPTVTVLQAPAKSTDFDDTIKTSIISGGYRYSKTAANKVCYLFSLHRDGKISDYILPL